MPLARCPSTTSPCRPDHPLAGAEVVDAGDLDGEPVLVVDRAEAPTAHDEIEAYCARLGARPRWITHAAVQVERVLDQVALGTGIGWLNSWQAEPALVAPTSPCGRCAGHLVRRVPRRVAVLTTTADDWCGECRPPTLARRLRAQRPAVSRAAGAAFGDSVERRTWP